LPLVSCADFFTNSWGKGSARDPGTIKVTSGNVKDLLKEAKGDTEASRGILNKIAEKLKGDPNPDPTLQRAAITAANQAAGLGQVVLENVGTLTDAVSGNADKNVIENLLKAVEDGAQGNKITEVSDSVNAVLKPAVKTKDGKPTLNKDVIAPVPDSELLLLATTLILAEAEKAGKSFDEYVSMWGTSTNKKLDGTGLTSSERLIAALVNELGERGTLGKDFKKMLEGGN
jgi:hypothetical protein